MIVSGLLFQLAYQDYIIMEPVFTLAMFMQYSNCQNAQLQIDPLTGLNNRFRFSRYILEQCKQLAVDDVMGCVVFSLDSVQNINERYGQGNGDLIIAEAADLLKECINGLAGNHYMARYSGKCLAVLSVASCDMSARIIQLYRDIVDEYNNSVENSFYISLSYGCATFDRYNMRPSELLSVAENDMQKNRTLNKVNVMSVEDLI